MAAVIRRDLCAFMSRDVWGHKFHNIIDQASFNLANINPSETHPTFQRRLVGFAGSEGLALFLPKWRLWNSSAHSELSRPLLGSSKFSLEPFRTGMSV